MKKKKKSVLLSIILTLCMALTPCAAFADTAPVPAKLTAPAASIDVSVTAKITMTATAGQSAMDVSDVTVTNNATMGTISLDSVAYGVDVDPWSLTLDTENFTTMGKDLHKFSLTADGQDLKAGNKTYDAKQLTPGASYTVAMEGKTGLSTVEVFDVQAGTVILTVSMVSAAGSGSGSGSSDTNPYLTFLGNEEFTLQTKSATATWDGTLEYSTDTATWNTWDGTEISSDENALYLRGSGNTKITGNSSDNYGFSLNGTGSLKISCKGNIENLLDYEAVSAGEHPAMDEKCYANLFRACTALTSAPSLPAITLTGFCYQTMFADCTSLTTAPELPATELAAYCYLDMFFDCTSLTTAPELPATTLAEGCYYEMFTLCTSLTASPELPATELAVGCYMFMFGGCASLASLPELPATTLAEGCYFQMFYGCSLIKLSATQTGEYQTVYRIPASGTGTTATDALTDMFTRTGGTFKGTPNINTTYYISNAVG